MKQPLYNMRLIERLKELVGFDSDDQETIIKMIDVMIVKGGSRRRLHLIDLQDTSG